MTRFCIGLHAPLVVFLFCALVAGPGAFALTKEELAARFKQLPTVAEKDLPAMKNAPESFTGIIKHEGLKGHTWVRFPFVENPGSFGFDRKGRLFVAEANRFWLGVPDLRGANQLVRGDFQSITVEDRQKLYDAYEDSFPEGWFTAVADRVVLLEDRDGNGAADHRTLFSDHFKHPLDGIGFSLLAEDDAVYFTCIPKVWKLVDEDGDGVADRHDTVAEGFGVRVSFIGHDLHGVIRGPDGRLYFSVGDRGYHVTDEEGKVHAASGRGAIFRCESDGSNFEVFCEGLRNPQELAFDDFGNLFTFDNTGDIGDKARLVYALEGSDSGWDMAHQSPHHYRTLLDWEQFHPELAMWVKERMYDTFNEEQPQWVYPPASHVARGPSGVTYLTGESLPEDLRNKFLLANYRGPSVNCTLLTIGIEPKGAGYVANHEEVLVEGVGASDVELGYDGNLYLCDFGGGWSVNQNGAIQVLTPVDEGQAAAGREMAERFARGLSGESADDLVALLGSSDKRMRQLAQFELVKREGGLETLATVAGEAGGAVLPRLHAIWGLGQLGRLGADVSGRLIALTGDDDMEVRANVARTLGSLRAENARASLLELTGDDSTRVRSLAAIALGRLAERGDEEVIDALYAVARENGDGEVDPVLRHAVLGALDHIGTEEAVVARASDESREVRLLSLLFLRRHESAELVRFLEDEDAQIRRDAVRAIYDTAACDGPAGEALVAMSDRANEYPESVQRRFVAANFRRGDAASAGRLVAMAGNEALEPSVREAALHGLSLWTRGIVTDPVLGHYRPLPNPEREIDALTQGIEAPLRELLAKQQPAKLTALALRLADQAKVQLAPDTLRAQVAKTSLEAEVRVAALDSLVNAQGSEARDVVDGLRKDKAPAVRAAAMRHRFDLGAEGVEDEGRIAVEGEALEVARAAINGLAASHPSVLAEYWEGRDGPEGGLRRELWLDVYLALQGSTDQDAQALAVAHAAAGPKAVFELSTVGGDPARGESVFRNQGACLQCHKVNGDGGIQGPDLSRVAERLTSEKLLESLVDPGAEISKGYGNSGIALKDGTVIAGRIAKEDNAQLEVIAMDGTTRVLQRSEVSEISPPVSAMPPLGATLPPRDLRDLVAFLAVQTAKGAKSKDAASHGEADEKIAK